MRENDQLAAQQERAVRVRRKARIVLLVGMTLVTLLVAGGIALWKRHSARVDPGRPAGGTVVELDGNKGVVVLVDDTEQLTGRRRNRGVMYRITTLDLATGAKQKMRIIEDSVACWAAAVGRVWCAGPLVGYLLLDAVTLETIANAKDLASKLGTPMLGDHDKPSAVPGGLAVLLNDGRYVRIDATTLAVTELEPTVHRDGLPDSAGCYTGTMEHGLRISSGTRAAIIPDTADVDKPPPADAPRYLSAQFVVTRDPALTLLRHRKTLDSKGSQLTRLDPEGRPLWTTDVSTEECEVIATTKSMMLMTTKRVGMRAFVLDLETGALRWTFHF